MTKHIFCLILIFTLLVRCNTEKRPSNLPRHAVTDALGRGVAVPNPIDKVITMRAGALRLMLYMGLADQVAYIERNDRTRVVPYMMAYPELKLRPLIGAGNNYDPEAIAVSDADLIIGTYLSEAEAETLSQKTGKPVFCLTYGDLYHYKSDFYNSLITLGRLFDRQSRADSLISYMESTIAAVNSRSKRSKIAGKSAYIGGVAFNGMQGISSTRAQYPPFVHAEIHNPVDALPAGLESIGAGQKNMLVDKEQIIQWSPDFLFMDASGRLLWSEELRHPALSAIPAVKQGQTFVVLPFNWHTINYENLLCNMWFIGKIAHPDTFSDVDVTEKCREIFTVFYGRDIYDEVRATYSPFEKSASDVR